jgi:hypothetical protein
LRIVKSSKIQVVVQFELSLLGFLGICHVFRRFAQNFLDEILERLILERGFGLTLLPQLQREIANI